MREVYEKDSLSLFGAVAMGTGVMIGAAVFGLTGHVAEFAGALLPLAFLLAAVVSGFSAYSYVKMSNAYPSAGGIATYLRKAYGPGTITGASALLMAFVPVAAVRTVAPPLQRPAPRIHAGSSSTRRMVSIPAPRVRLGTDRDLRDFLTEHFDVAAFEGRVTGLLVCHFPRA